MHCPSRPFRNRLMALQRGGCRGSRQPPAAAPSGPTSAPERGARPPPAALSPGLNRCTMRGPGHSSPEMDSRQELYRELPCGPAEACRICIFMVNSSSCRTLLCALSQMSLLNNLSPTYLSSLCLNSCFPEMHTLISKPLLFRNKQFLSPRLGEALS